MKLRQILLVFLLLGVFSPFANAQRVGVVLSGGGGKGLAHVGLLKALEEQGIKIDYIAGTSAGAIVGGLYAAGYSPDQIEQLVMSKDYARWASGEIEDSYIYYFKQQRKTPYWVQMKFNYDTTFKSKLPTNFISPYQMDFAIMQIFAGSNVACKGNFDSLFVPFRCVATKVETSKAVVFRNGDVGDAVRASMTYPIFFKPIKVNGDLMMDGGIVNNFPADVMYEDFKPDVVIGSKAVRGDLPPDEDDVFSQIECVVMGQTNFNLYAEKSILISPHLIASGVTDLTYLKRNIDSAYVETMRRMPEIKKMVHDSISKNEINIRRQAFNKKCPPIEIDNIYISGLSRLQSLYINRLLKQHRVKTSINDIKKEYFKLVADDKIESVTPKLRYNFGNASYDMFLDVKRDKNLVAQLGGNLSSSSMNEIMLELRYKYLGATASTVAGNVYFGKFYNSGQLMWRVDLPNRTPFYLETAITYNQFDYFSSSTHFYEDKTPSFLIKSETFLRLNAGMPASTKGKFELGVTGGYLNNDYYQTNNFSRSDTADMTHFDVVSPYMLFEINSLNERQYSWTGIQFVSECRYVKAWEKTVPGSTSLIKTINRGEHDIFHAHVKYMNYFKSIGLWHLGFHLEGYLSNQQLLDNYASSILVAPAFAPIPESNTLFLRHYIAYNYLAGGIKNVFVIQKKLHLRLEAYIFQPYKEILRQTDNTAKFGKPFAERYFMASSVLVYHTLFGPLSLSANYYDRNDEQYSIMLSFGFTIFNRKALE
ncbi:MAG: patatin-like phospholipase family protein [Bacteroidota bacterium]